MQAKGLNTQNGLRILNLVVVSLHLQLWKRYRSKHVGSPSNLWISTS